MAPRARAILWSENSDQGNVALAGELQAFRVRWTSRRLMLVRNPQMVLVHKNIPNVGLGSLADVEGSPP